MSDRNHAAAVAALHGADIDAAGADRDLLASKDRTIEALRVHVYVLEDLLRIARDTIAALTKR